MAQAYSGGKRPAGDTALYAVNCVAVELNNEHTAVFECKQAVTESMALIVPQRCEHTF